MNQRGNHFVQQPPRVTRANGKCPYCQQALPVDFEIQIAACFDAQYQQDIDALRQFRDAYELDMRGFIELLKANQSGLYPKLDLAEYSDKVALFEKQVKINIQMINEKLREPSTIVTLENVKAIVTAISIRNLSISVLQTT